MGGTSRQVRAVIVGLGAIGAATAEECIRLHEFELVAAIDPPKAGAKLGALTVQESFSGLSSDGADVAIMATGSSLDSVADQFEGAMRLGMDVVSTCEELAFPWVSHAKIADHLDEVAKAEARRLLGCGVNPGFVMDAIPVLLSTATLGAGSIRVTRSVDLNRRRPQLSSKLGIGLDEQTWRRRAEIEGFGHRGLIESAHLCAVGLGWEVKETDFAREPLLRNGMVSGVREVVALRDSEGRRVTLELSFEVGAEDRDAIEIDGSPPLRVVFEGGVQGDRATVALLLHAARVVGGLPPGLRLPIEVPGWVPPR